MRHLSVGIMFVLFPFDFVLSKESQFCVRKPFIACNDDTCELADKVVSLVSL